MTSINILSFINLLALVNLSKIIFALISNVHCHKKKRMTYVSTLLCVKSQNNMFRFIIHISAKNGTFNIERWQHLFNNLK